MSHVMDHFNFNYSVCIYIFSTNRMPFAMQQRALEPDEPVIFHIHFYHCSLSLTGTRSSCFPFLRIICLDNFLKMCGTNVCLNLYFIILNNLFLNYDIIHNIVFFEALGFRVRLYYCVMNKQRL